MGGALTLAPADLEKRACTKRWEDDDSTHFIGVKLERQEAARDLLL